MLKNSRGKVLGGSGALQILGKRSQKLRSVPTAQLTQLPRELQSVAPADSSLASQELMAAL